VNPFQSLRDYEAFIYSLPQQFIGVQRSTLTLIRKGRSFAELVGEIHLAGTYRLTIYELLHWRENALSIKSYGYEVWAENEKLYWYDSQPHPHDPSLASTHPHHKHVPPDIKHNRIPAPDLSFTAPNLLFLIQEIEDLLQENEGKT
jgi:hypothetical protein